MNNSCILIGCRECPNCWSCFVCEKDKCHCEESEVFKLLEKYFSNDECIVDGAPDASNTDHFKNCSWCQAAILIEKIRKK